MIDPSGAVVPNAALTATNSDVSYEVQAFTNNVGTYTFSNLPGGHYTVEARVPGFAIYHVTNLALVNGGSLRVDASLAVGSMREHIVVTPQGVPKPQVAVSTASTQPIRVGGMVKAAALTRQVKPAYPADLLAQGVEATVLLQAIISKEGVPQSLTPQNAGINQEFIDAAMAAVRQWRFRPTTLNGEPIEVATTVQVDFKLGGAALVIDDKLR